jgi:N-acetylmuramoyl-L-alanine amidase
LPLAEALRPTLNQGDLNLKRNWLWLSLLSIVLFSSPAEAAKLQFWRFDAGQNRLQFTTDEGVQPSVQLIPNPARLVIDLPGVVWGRSQMTQSVGQAVQSVRIAQLNPQTTRIVIELAAGYTLDPQQIRVRAASPTDWSVELPVPQFLGQANQPMGGNAQGSSVPQRSGYPSAQLNSFPQPSNPAIIQKISLGGNQLLIGANQPLFYATRWDGNAYRITIRSAQLDDQFQDVRLGAGSALTQLQIQQDKAQKTVTIFAYPAAGVRITRLARLNAQSLLLQLQRPGELAAPFSVGNVQPPNGSIALSPAAPLPRIPSAGQLVVVIDPGHGGPDPGAIGIGGLQEKGVVLDISTQVAALLQQQGVQAILTRPDDRDLGLAPRVALAVRMRANVFVSIHANAISMSRPDINGLETFYYSTGLPLAKVAHSNILQSIMLRDRGVRQANFYVIKRNPIPAILIEAGYLTGAEDAPKLADAGFRNQVAMAIARGILQYLQPNTLPNP